MSLVPVVAAQRAGFRVRPLVALSDPALRSVARVGAWGGLLLAGAQLLIGTTLLLSNRVQGGVVAYQIAFTFFLLPFALIAHPVFTALYPRMAASAHEERWEQFAAEVRDGSTRLATFLLPASGLLIALAHPGLRAVHVGALDEHGAALIADVLVPYAAGLLSYGAFHLLARAWTAAAAPRVPAVVGLAASAAGAVAMWLMAGAGAGDARVTRLGWAHSAAMTAAAAALLVLLRRRIGHGLLLTASLVRGLIAGAAAWSAAAAAVRVFDGPGRLAAVTATVFGGLAGVAAAGAVVAVLRAARRAHAVTS
jgi:putative peptidoglycan lipid II flippase